MTENEKIIEEAKKDMLPFESWEQLKGEKGEAFAAFCVFRDLGAGRNIRKAFEKTKNVTVTSENQYGGWRNWASKFRWTERAADYDRYLEKLKQTENRKTIEAQAEKHREVTGKMLDVVIKKLDTMNPADLTQGGVTEWVQTAIKSEREAANLWFEGLVTESGKAETKQGEFSFVNDFEGL